jgi:hypothetical protein
VSASGNTRPTRERLARAIAERYRCPDQFLNFDLSGDLNNDAGYFRFGPDTICYGRATIDGLCESPNLALEDCSLRTKLTDSRVELPFDPTEVIDNLRWERYPESAFSPYRRLFKRAYYFLRPPSISLRKWVQKFHLGSRLNAAFPKWPVDTTVEDIAERCLLLALQAGDIKRIPFVWFWPRGFKSCLIMTHDVETKAGLDFCSELMDLDQEFGVPASFQIVPEGRYEVPHDLLESMRRRGFEVAIQDLNHDGRLFDSEGEFVRRAALINQYAKEYAAEGFRAAVLYRRPEWLHKLKISYDMSVPNVARLDPQPGGCCTVLPYFLGDIVELPVTTVQDYMLLHILSQSSIDLWKSQLDLICAKNGLASFIVHPDYIIDQKSRSIYRDLLAYLQSEKVSQGMWRALPREVDRWWRKRSQMTITQHGNSWRIVGDGVEDAVLAYASISNGKLVYEVETGEMPANGAPLSPLAAT